MGKIGKSTRKKMAEICVGNRQKRLVAELACGLHAAFRDFCLDHDLVPPADVECVMTPKPDVSGETFWVVRVPMTYGALAMVPSLPEAERRDCDRIPRDDMSEYALCVPLDGISGIGDSIGFFPLAVIQDASDPAVHLAHRGPEDDFVVIRDCDSLSNRAISDFIWTGVLRTGETTDNPKEFFDSFLDEWVFGPDAWMTARERRLFFLLADVSGDISRRSPILWLPGPDRRKGEIVVVARIRNRREAECVGRFAGLCRGILDRENPFSGRSADIEIVSVIEGNSADISMFAPAVPGERGEFLGRVEIDIMAPGFREKARSVADLIAERYGLVDIPPLPESPVEADFYAPGGFPPKVTAERFFVGAANPAIQDMAGRVGSFRRM